jgi:hypothetical protein
MKSQNTWQVMVGPEMHRQSEVRMTVADVHWSHKKKRCSAGAFYMLGMIYWQSFPLRSPRAKEQQQPIKLSREAKGCSTDDHPKKPYS